MRGSWLFTDLFGEEYVTTSTKKKGRDFQLNEQRDILLINRYFYYGQHTDLRYGIIMKRMSDEFFLTQSRIQKIIESRTQVLHKLRKNPPSVKILKQKWPHFVW